MSKHFNHIAFEKRLHPELQNSAYVTLLQQEIIAENEKLGRPEPDLVGKNNRVAGVQADDANIDGDYGVHTERALKSLPPESQAAIAARLQKERETFAGQHHSPPSEPNAAMLKTAVIPPAPILPVPPEKPAQTSTTTAAPILPPATPPTINTALDDNAIFNANVNTTPLQQQLIARATAEEKTIEAQTAKDKQKKADQAEALRRQKLAEANPNAPHLLGEPHAVPKTDKDQVATAPVVAPVQTAAVTPPPGPPQARPKVMSDVPPAANPVDPKNPRTASIAPTTATAPPSARSMPNGTTTLDAYISTKGSFMNFVKDGKVIDTFEIASGNGKGYNNLAMQDVKKHGPVPVGNHHLSEREAPFFGQRAIRMSSNDPHRDGFLIHSDSIRYLGDLKNPGASEGCITIKGGPKEYKRFLAAYDHHRPRDINVAAPTGTEPRIALANTTAQSWASPN